MLFNSYLFCVLFLPVALGIYHCVSAFGRTTLRRATMVTITLAFYGFGAARFLPLLLASVFMNFVVGIAIQKAKDQGLSSRLWLFCGVFANLAILFYYKYAEVTFAFIDESIGLNWGFSEKVVLPLAISFYTFQQIGFLVDVSRDKVRVSGILQYAGFVLFFPSIISGPIVKFDETVPQIERTVISSEVWRNILIGLTIFSIGLFKKTVIADSIAVYTSPVINGVGMGESVSFLIAWSSALLYTLQIYFDFSGYSDMAIGVARMFSIILPPNFHSPLKSDGYVEIWRRWHMTLGRWVQSYIFQPLSIPFARFASARDYSGLGFMALSTYLPTVISMVILGVWHGSGINFFLFGLMNGVFMTINEVWLYLLKQRRKRLGLKKVPTGYLRKVFARGLTLFAFVLSCVPFAHTNFGGTKRMFASMAGLGAPQSSTLSADWPLGLAGAMLLILVGYTAVFCLPNTQQIMARFKPCLEWDKWKTVGVPPLRWQWSMSVPGAVFTGLTLFIGFVLIARGSMNFIYFGF